MTEQATMTVGKNLPFILLDVAQTHISKGDFEKGMNVYRESLGMPDDLIINVLKANGGLVVNEDGTLVNYVDDPKVCEEFKPHLYDWDCILKNWAERIHEHTIKLNEYFTQVGCIWDLNPSAESYAGKNNACAQMILENKNNQTGSPTNFWMKVMAEYEGEHADEHTRNLVAYKMIIDQYRYLKKELEFYSVYKLLCHYGMAKHIHLIELYITDACNYIIDNTINKNNLQKIMMFNTYELDNPSPRMNSMLMEFFPSFFEELQNLVIKNFPDYMKYGYMPCDIMDGYDAGYLSPEGLFFGANGHENELLHSELSTAIVKHLYPEYKQDSQQCLTEHGWMAIHNDRCYCIFSGMLEHYAADPTDEQIDMFCKYIDSFYGGKYSLKLHPNFSNEEDWISTYKLKSADRFCRRDLLTSF